MPFQLQLAYAAKIFVMFPSNLVISLQKTKISAPLRMSVKAPAFPRPFRPPTTVRQPRSRPQCCPSPASHAHLPSPTTSRCPLLHTFVPPHLRFSIRRQLIHFFESTSVLSHWREFYRSTSKSLYTKIYTTIRRRTNLPPPLLLFLGGAPWRLTNKCIIRGADAGPQLPSSSHSFLLPLSLQFTCVNWLFVQKRITIWLIVQPACVTTYFYLLVRVRNYRTACTLITLSRVVKFRKSPATGLRSRSQNSPTRKGLFLPLQLLTNGERTLIVQVKSGIVMTLICVSRTLRLGVINFIRNSDDTLGR